MSSVAKPWHAVPTQVVAGVKRALLIPATREQAIEFCRDMAVKQGAETVHHSPAKWLESARKTARNESLQAYSNAIAMQHYHWRKLVEEMRAIEDLQP